MCFSVRCVPRIQAIPAARIGDAGSIGIEPPLGRGGRSAMCDPTRRWITALGGNV